MNLMNVIDLISELLEEINERVGKHGLITAAAMNRWFSSTADVFLR